MDRLSTQRLLYQPGRNEMPLEKGKDEAEGGTVMNIYKILTLCNAAMVFGLWFGTAISAWYYRRDQRWLG